MRNRVILIVLGVVALMVVGRLLFPGPAPHVSLAAEQVFHIGPIPIENTTVAAFVTALVILFLFWRASSNAKPIPERRSIQNALEMILEGFMGLCASVAGPQNGRRFFPLVITIFLFVFVSNYLGLLPGYHTIGWFHPEEDHGAAWNEVHVGPLTVAILPFNAPQVEGHDDHAPEGMVVGNLAPWLRSANTSLNTTLAIALVAMFFVEMWGLRDLGIGYLGKFINVRRLMRGDIMNGLIDFFVGIIDIISELARIVSLSFRLFGNILAGEVLLSVMTFLVSWVVIVLFLGLELLVGVIQALVFAQLTLVVATIAVTSHEEHAQGEHESQAAHH
jgi:F-type H+-transporting ATPase subunit a